NTISKFNTGGHGIDLEEPWWIICELQRFPRLRSDEPEVFFTRVDFWLSYLPLAHRFLPVGQERQSLRYLGCSMFMRMFHDEYNLSALNWEQRITFRSAPLKRSRVLLLDLGNA